MVSAHIRHYADPSKTVTVLTNGGAQRGHTVTAKDGSRFVFHHLGASMKGDANITYCPSTFVINPMVLMQDMREVKGWVKGKPTVYINPDCLVTTPYDMMANQIEELRAGDARWGSTGMGVWHTKHRSRYVPLSALDLFKWIQDENLNTLKRRLQDICEFWLYSALRLQNIPDSYNDLFNSEGLVAHWIQDVADMVLEYAICGSPFHESIYDTAVFENAQGLLLSSDNGCHSTSSSTRAGAITRLVGDENLGNPDDVKLCYVSRTYMTRHGDGPLPNECPREILNTTLNDKTNIWNQWQGNLRYGLLDESILEYRIKNDLRQIGIGWKNATLVMTHVNEVPYRRQEFSDLNIVESDDPYMLNDKRIVK